MKGTKYNCWKIEWQKKNVKLKWTKIRKKDKRYRKYVIRKGDVKLNEKKKEKRLRYVEDMSVSIKAKWHL